MTRIAEGGVQRGPDAARLSARGPCLKQPEPLRAAGYSEIKSIRTSGNQYVAALIEVWDKGQQVKHQKQPQLTELTPSARKP